jgi:hypothetical protein
MLFMGRAAQGNRIKDPTVQKRTLHLMDGSDCFRFAEHKSSIVETSPFHSLTAKSLPICVNCGAVLFGIK